MVFPIVFFARRIFLPFTQSRIYWQSCLQNLTVICKYVFNRDKKPLFRVIHYVSLLFFKFRKLVNIVHVVIYLYIETLHFVQTTKDSAGVFSWDSAFVHFLLPTSYPKQVLMLYTNILFFIIENHSIFFPKEFLSFFLIKGSYLLFGKQIADLTQSRFLSCQVSTWLY